MIPLDIHDKPWVEQVSYLISLLLAGPPLGIRYDLGAYQGFVAKTLDDLRHRATEAP